MRIKRLAAGPKSYCFSRISWMNDLCCKPLLRMQAMSPCSCPSFTVSWIRLNFSGLKSSQASQWVLILMISWNSSTDSSVECIGWFSILKRESPTPIICCMQGSLWKNLAVIPSHNYVEVFPSSQLTSLRLWARVQRPSRRNFDENI
jgi:hypothetical protein